MASELDAFFQSYVEAFNRSLGDKVDAKGIAAHFADSFIGSGPAGVRCAKNDAEFIAFLEQGYAFYKQVGTERMEVRKVDTVPIDAAHTLATVSFRAHYRKKSGERIHIDFAVRYFVRTAEHGPLIFGFVSCDEMAEFRRHGLID
jgi:hypothetical protein